MEITLLSLIIVLCILYLFTYLISCKSNSDNFVNFYDDNYVSWPLYKSRNSNGCNPKGINGWPMSNVILPEHHQMIQYRNNLKKTSSLPELVNIGKRPSIPHNIPTQKFIDIMYPLSSINTNILPF